MSPAARCSLAATAAIRARLAPLSPTVLAAPAGPEFARATGGGPIKTRDYLFLPPLGVAGGKFTSINWPRYVRHLRTCDTYHSNQKNN